MTASGGTPDARRMRVDTVRTVETPEGCLLTLRIAGPYARARAWLVDLGVRLVAYIVGASAAGMFDAFGLGFVLLLVFALEWGYPVAFEIWSHGQTPGKRMCGLAVVHDDGTPVGSTASVVRNLLRAVDFLPVGYVAAAVTMLVAGRGQRLGDLAAGTVVVHVGTPVVVVSRSWEESRTERPRIALTARERRAVVDFARRHSRVSAARAEELARLAVPLVSGAGPVSATTRLLRIANTILGADGATATGRPDDAASPR